MKLLTYRAKLLLNFIALFAVFAIILVVFQQRREHSYRNELLETRLRSYADLVANSVEDENLNHDSLAMAHFMESFPGDLRITIISKRGLVRYETGTGQQAEKMDNHMGRPEIRKALANVEGTDIRVSETTGRAYYYFAKAYGDFAVRVALPYDDTVQDFMKPDNIFLWFVLLIFPIILVVLIYISDHFGKAIVGLRHFIDSAERGLIDYDHITFPRSELGNIGRTVMHKYQQLEQTNRQIAAERERLIRHFHYFEEGIAIFTPDRRKIYANPRFIQYVNTILDSPTPDVSVIWSRKEFAPAAEFLALHADHHALHSVDVPVFRFTLTAGSICYALQILIYSDGSFEMSLADVTQTEKTKRLKQQMSNNITHELRTPVSSIRGYIETIQGCTTLSEEKRRYFLDRAHAQVVRLTDLIRDVALISKTEEAPDTMPVEPLVPGEIVADIIEELREGLEREQITVENLLDTRLKITGNYSLIHAIFRNLMENSIRYAGAQASIRIECYNDDDEYAYFRYYDTGNGVEEEHLTRLFERFYRVGEGRTRDHGGTGLGLSIVRNAVLFHNGNISARNRKGGGLEFLFTLKR